MGVAEIPTIFETVTIGLTFLAPGFGHGLVFVQGMGSPAEVLQVRQSSKDGDQKFQHFGLGRVPVGFLLQGKALEALGQPDILGKGPPAHQQGVLGIRWAFCLRS